MSGSFTSSGELDLSANLIISCYGRKGSGKSIMAKTIFDSYPHDRIVIDVAGDDGPGVRHSAGQATSGGETVWTFTGPMDECPQKWPEHLRDDRRRMTLRYVPDPGSPTYLADLDHWMGIGYRRGRCMILVHEVHDVAPAGRVPPHTRRVLRHSRHRQLTVALCGPRTLTCDPLVIGQSDLVFIFEMPQPADRKRAAEVFGWDPADLDDAVHELGRHEYLRFDARQAAPADGEPDLRLVAFPPLPADLVKRVKSL